MSRIIKTEVFKYAELSPEAKGRARDWFRTDLEFDADCVYEDAAMMAAHLGIDLNTRRVKLMDGSTRYDPNIYYSGFSSQGDGACFEGGWAAKSVDAAALKSEAPKDAELHRIADALAGIAKDYPDASASTKHRGHYYHSGCMSVECAAGEGTEALLAKYANPDDAELLSAEDAEQMRADRYAEDFPEEKVTRLLRDFADWIYAQLEREWDYRNKDETVAEDIEANEYEFTADGHIA